MKNEKNYDEKKRKVRKKGNKQERRNREKWEGNKIKVKN
jgi:hypothetical protein